MDRRTEEQSLQAIAIQNNLQGVSLNVAKSIRGTSLNQPARAAEPKASTKAGSPGKHVQATVQVLDPDVKQRTSGLQAITLLEQVNRAFRESLIKEL